MPNFVVTWLETIVIKRQASVVEETKEEAIEVIKGGDRTKQEKAISVKVSPYHTYKTKVAL